MCALSQNCRLWISVRVMSRNSYFQNFPGWCSWSGDLWIGRSLKFPKAEASLQTLSTQCSLSLLPTDSAAGSWRPVWPLHSLALPASIHNVSHLLQHHPLPCCLSLHPPLRLGRQKKLTRLPFKKLAPRQRFAAFLFFSKGHVVNFPQGYSIINHFCSSLGWRVGYFFPSVVVNALRKKVFPKLKSLSSQSTSRNWVFFFSFSSSYAGRMHYLSLGVFTDPTSCYRWAQQTLHVDMEKNHTRHLKN